MGLNKSMHWVFYKTNYAKNVDSGKAVGGALFKVCSLQKL